MIEFEPNRRMVVDVLDAPVPAPIVIDLTPDDGGTRLDWTGIISPRGIWALTAPLIARFYRMAFEKDLRNLKALMDRGELSATYRRSASERSPVLNNLTVCKGRWTTEGVPIGGLSSGLTRTPRSSSGSFRQHGRSSITLRPDARSHYSPRRASPRPKIQPHARERLLPTPAECDG